MKSHYSKVRQEAEKFISIILTLAEKLEEAEKLLSQLSIQFNKKEEQEYLKVLANFLDAVKRREGINEYISKVKEERKKGWIPIALTDIERLKQERNWKKHGIDSNKEVNSF